MVELEHCVIKGSLSRPHRDAVRKGYLPMRMPSDADDHFMYSIIGNGNGTGNGTGNGNGNGNGNGTGANININTNTSSSSSSQQQTTRNSAKIDYRLHFLINHGSLSFPSKLFIMKPHCYEKICLEACQLYLSDAIHVDVRRWSVLVPRICDIYRGDFGEDNVSILQYCKKLVDYTTQKEIQDVMAAAKHATSVVLKFDKYLCESRKNLEVIDSI